MKKTWTVWYHSVNWKAIHGIEADSEQAALMRVQQMLAHEARRLGVGCPTAERAELETHVQTALFA